MRSRRIKCICGQGIGSFLKPNRLKKGDRMNDQWDFRDTLILTIKKAVDYDFGYDDFFDQVRWAIMDAIEEGYIFRDYLNIRDEIEDPHDMSCGLDEWEIIVERAFRKQGHDYEKLKNDQIRLDTAIAEKMQEALDNKEIVVNVKMEEIIKRAFDSLNEKKDSTDTDWKHFD
jgi:hypothetical protein